ncbi:hypothetical protein [Acidomonas methanolica]|uniref:Uncharacterized protein n=1 Tax=Acidomonas methanolica NBRC 104435 TaxID=1231351 RepID=A0A023D8X4_ACIMT|nr:hypothetical protein [Acidomonas methanolica]MBU2655744.1 hypothetical protein [Acidomonas methanolica]TCS19660.1 hypothetical protein EDC31_1558 [Acidomonas methanolica]GAJ30578.1 hypothetical protein Amme_185_002 [Acidomonas methanolica NBRC 104435]GBQ55672.1 hypothetical protein AA0498_2288 [Acidomonas methanolica]GEL00756.1 hypothetical protein AME01nite_32540 [Acidomonas methanolica NBRC 104435]
MLLGLGIVLGVAGIGFLCWLLFLCAVYAAPLFVAAMVCTMLYDHAMMSGAHAVLAGIAAGITVLALGQAILASTRDCVLRVIVSALFALPAALAGFGMTLGLSRLGDMGAIPTYIFATFGALCVGGAAWTRLCAIQPT